MFRQITFIGPFQRTDRRDKINEYKSNTFNSRTDGKVNVGSQC